MVHRKARHQGRFLLNVLQRIRAATVRILFLCATGAAGMLCTSASAQSIAFTNVRIVDGNGGAPIEHGTIVIQGQKILAVGPISNISIPPGARTIDEGGRTALPGLADMHVHLTGGWDGVSADMLGYQRYMNALLYAGVTTVLDTGNVESYILQLRAETAAGRLLGPRIYCVGPLVDGPDAFWPELSRIVVSQDQVPRLVAGPGDGFIASANIAEEGSNEKESYFAVYSPPFGIPGKSAGSGR